MLLHVDGGICIIMCVYMHMTVPVCVYDLIVCVRRAQRLLHPGPPAFRWVMPLGNRRPQMGQRTARWEAQVCTGEGPGLSKRPNILEVFAPEKLLGKQMEAVNSASTLKTTSPPLKGGVTPKGYIERHQGSDTVMSHPVPTLGVLEVSAQPTLNPVPALGVLEVSVPHDPTSVAARSPSPRPFRNSGHLGTCWSPRLHPAPHKCHGPKELESPLATGQGPHLSPRAWALPSPRISRPGLLSGF